MIKELISHPWAVWSAVAIVSAIIEVSVPSFSFIFAAIAAVITALAAPYTGWPVQVATFVIVLFVSILFVRPKFVEKFHNQKKIISRADTLLNEEGVVTKAIGLTHKTGRVLVCGQDWAAQSEAPIPTHQKIVVTGSDGIVLSVKEI